MVGRNSLLISDTPVVAFIRGGNAKENAEILLSVLQNQASPYLETTVLNAGPAERTGYSHEERPRQDHLDPTRLLHAYGPYFSRPLPCSLAYLVGFMVVPSMLCSQMDKSACTAFCRQILAWKR